MLLLIAANGPQVRAVIGYLTGRCRPLRGFAVSWRPRARVVRLRPRVLGLPEPQAAAARRPKGALCKSAPMERQPLGLERRVVAKDLRALRFSISLCAAMVRCQRIDGALIDSQHMEPKPGTRLHASVSDELSARRTGMSFQRTRMSADRTLMSAIRTALSLIAFGFTIFQVFHHMVDAKVLGNASAPRNFGVALVLIG